MEQAGISGRCIATPALFFTLAGANPKSERVLTLLCGTIREKYPDIPQPEFPHFSNKEAIEKYLREAGIDGDSAIGVFDASNPGGSCFSFLFLKQGQEKKRVAMPNWIPTTIRWAVAINSNIDERCVKAAANQMTADFFKHRIQTKPETKLLARNRNGATWRSERGKRRREEGFLSFAHFQA